MPELPEVETMRRGLLPIVGRTIAAVVKPRCARRPIAVRPGWTALRRRLAGQTVADVARFGKRVVLVAGSGDRLVIEPRMTGLVVLADPPTTDHLRLAIGFQDEAAPTLWFWDRRGLGTVTLLSEGEYAAFTTGGRVGPDALAVDAEAFRARLGRSTLPIKVALLDQKRLAGIGNLYASEACHVAGIDPRRPAAGLTDAQWLRLWTAVRDVLEEAILCEGSTLGDGTYRTALGSPGSYQNRHRVYARTGAACPRCQSPEATVARIVQAQRATFYCAACQA